jgi:uncharacterized protein (TIGR02246 family)
MLNSPDDFTRSFVAAWVARDAAALAGLCAEDAEMVTATGLWCDGRQRIADGLQAELAGAFSRSRLVTGKGRLRPLGPGAAVLTQRFVLSGIVDADGGDAGQVSAVLMAILLHSGEGWLATTLHFTALAA